jgi:glucose-6-phosphate 1-dehydrogenase
VTALEDFGIGLRGGYYDLVGALKDVGQNHLLQMAALTTMDKPDDYTNPAITQKRIDLIQSLIPDPERIVFGQYRGYLSEKNVRPDSKTDTFFAFRTFSKIDRLKDVPIYVRAGKFLARTATEVSVVFKNNPGNLISPTQKNDSPNVLIYRIAPNEGIVLRFLTKIPGPDLKLENEYMQFCYRNMGKMLPDPYLRLLLDALRGDQTFFIDAPEVEAQWRFTDQLSIKNTNPEIYEPGSWGPGGADKLIESDGRKWLEPSVSFCAL